MRVRRLILIALVTVGLSPGTLWRDRPLWRNDKGPRVVDAKAVNGVTPAPWPDGLRLVGAWHLTSPNSAFGGYSALLATPGNTLTATSDVGRSLRFHSPDLPGPTDPVFARVPKPESLYGNSDIEASTEDSVTGHSWYAYEGFNAIQRFDPADRSGKTVRPQAMRRWPYNGGPEAMVRLADGRFVILSEDSPWLSSGARPGLLFPADPVSGAKPVEFSFRPPIGFHPSDMAALPDGRVVILLRALDLPFPPFFRGMLLVADPASIAPGKEWAWRKLADLVEPLPIDNYEGLAIVPEGDGVAMWLISDDNFARYQRTLLLKLHWQVPPRTAAD